MNIIPAILENNFLEIKVKLNTLATLKKKYNLTFDKVQIDLCDGVFVKNKTWLPSEDLEEMKNINLFENDFSFEYHIMCENIEYYLDNIKDLNAKSVVIHIDNFLYKKYDSKCLLDIFNKIKDFNLKLIISAKNESLLENENNFLDFINFLKDVFVLNKQVFVQIMGIKNVGLQGQEFDEDCIKLILSLRENFEENINIQVDGAINDNTLKILQDLSKVESVVVGSYLMNSLNLEEEFLERYNKLSSY